MHDDIDKLLAGEEPIVPSPGFLPAVMAAVQREAELPAPLPFPWLRALPGFVALLTALGLVVGNLISTLGDPDALAALNEQALKAVSVASSYGLPWIVLAAAVTVAALKVPSGMIRPTVPAPKPFDFK